MEVKVVTHSGLEGIREACEISRGTPFSEGLFERILKAGHLSILEHAFISFKITGISRVCSHQFVRKRIASYLQESQRHRDIEGFIIPESLKEKDLHKKLSIRVFNNYRNTNKILSNDDVAREDTRYLAPQAAKTSIVASYNLHSFWNLLDFRFCMRALKEYRELAKLMYIRASEIFPQIMKYWMPRCIKKYGRYCPEPCKENVMIEFNKLREGLFDD